MHFAVFPNWRCEAKGAQRIAAFDQNQRTAGTEIRFQLLRGSLIHTCIAVAQHYKFGIYLYYIVPGLSGPFP